MMAFLKTKEKHFFIPKRFRMIIRLPLHFTLSIICVFTLAFSVSGQTRVFDTFKDTRVINAPSVETLPARHIDIRIGHRFGDVGTGWETLYGLENAADVLIGFDFGLTDNIMIGLNRTKGTRLRQLINVPVKWRFLSQTEDDRIPVSIAVYGLGTISTQRKSSAPEEINFFEEFNHRMVYHGSLTVARKFGQRFSLQVGAGITHRNAVPFGDENDLVHINGAFRIQLTKVIGLIADASYVFSELRNAENSGFYPPIGFGLEFETGGHVFQLNFTNSMGMAETDYIPYTDSNWGDEEFRLGFTISRLFKI